MSKFVNKVFFNKYKVKKLITITNYSSIYEGINEKKNEPVIMKFEEKNKNEVLENEAYLLYYLNGLGIPKIISYGKNNSYNILIEELLGMNLYQIWELKENKTEYKLKTICMIALQILDRLEFIHSKNIIHRDIKPNNFLIGRKDPEIIYLIDFGISVKYKSSRTGKHIKYKFKKIINGSLKYLSINAIKGYEQSRRDDLESLGYMLIHLILNHLPWLYIENLEIENLEKIKQIYKAKLLTPPELLCNGLPDEFTQYIKYCRNLTFEQEPDYNYLKSLFNNILEKNQQKNDLNFYWIINNKKLKIKNEEINNRRNRSYKKKESSHQRLYLKIKNSLEKKNSSLEKLENKSTSFNNKNINNKIDKIPEFKYNIIKTIEFNNYNLENSNNYINYLSNSTNKKEFNNKKTLTNSIKRIDNINIKKNYKTIIDINKSYNLNNGNKNKNFNDFKNYNFDINKQSNLYKIYKDNNLSKENYKYNNFSSKSIKKEKYPNIYISIFPYNYINKKNYSTIKKRQGNIANSLYNKNINFIRNIDENIKKIIINNNSYNNYENMNKILGNTYFKNISNNKIKNSTLNNCNNISVNKTEKKSFYS